MITAKELREMKTTQYGEKSVDLELSLYLVMVDIIYAAKDGKDYYHIDGEEYFDRESTESCYVLDYLEYLGYRVCGDVECDWFGVYTYSTIISWGK